jgi:catecholate siderophore receptor
VSTINTVIRRPVSLRQSSAVVALGMSAALMAPSAHAQTVQATSADEVELETLRIEDKAADVNPYTQKGAPYKARVSGDNRRVKPLAETPATITVVTQTQIQESGRNDLRTILDAQPGVTVGTGENGNAFGDRYIIRGQEAKSDVFIDGLRDPGLQTRETFALEQIEITKGPSATFAGRGASGGAVNGITKQASLDYSFHAIDLTGGTDNHVRATLDSNMRLSDNFALRTNLMFTSEDVPDRDPARHRRFGAAIAANAQLSDKVSVLLDYYHLTVRDRQDLGQAIANAANGGQPYTDIPAYAQNEDFQNASVNVITGRVRIEAFDGFRIENAARYGKTTNGYVNTSVARFTRGALDPTAPNAIDYRINTSRAGWQDIDFFADRLNMTGEFNTGGWTHNLVTGVEYTTYSVDNRFGALNISPTALSVNATSASGYTYGVTGAPNCINGTGAVLNAWCVTDGRGNALSNRNQLLQRSGIQRSNLPATIWKVQTIAGYLMDSIDITDWLNISGGVRFDAFDFQLKSNNLLTGAQTSDYNYNGVLWSYNAGLSLKPSDHSTIYAAYATGADINGGESDVGTNCGYGGLCTASVNGDVIYQGKPEKSENIEIGMKVELFDQRLLLTTALFQTTKRDIFEGGTNSYLATGSLNSGKLRVRGIEYGLVGNVTERLSGQVSVALMDAKVLKSVVDPASVGRTIANFAENSVDAQLRYQLTDRLVFGGTATYQSEMFGGQPDTAAAWNSTTNSYNVRIPGYTTFGAFVSYKVNDHLTARINAVNLTDKLYYVAAYRSGSFAYLGDGRTIRLTLSGKF